MRTLLRFLFRRQAARFLPGGWVALLLLNPRTRAYARSLWVRGRARGRGASPRP
ncbi:MAG: hypothetical protein M3P39_08025 [Actinomycetota bacterium]|jgi:hypothetical protein|nr:hypothetical protein [Actinomycetota bacterium]